MERNDLIGLYVSYSLFNYSVGIFGSFLPIHLNSLGASMFIISLRSAIPSLFIIFALPIWGMLSYKIQRRKIFIMIGMIANVLSLFLFIFLKTPIQFIITIGFFSLFTCALQSNIRAFVTQKMEKKGKASGLLLMSRSIGLSLGALTGGIIFDIFGIQVNFILGFVSSILAVLTLLRLTETQVVPNISKFKFFDITPYKTVLKNRNLIPVYLTIFVYIFGLTFFVSLFSVYFIQIGGSKTILGVANSVMFLIAIIVSTPAGIIADKIGRKPLMVFGTLCCALTTGLLYFTNDILITAILWSWPLHPYISISSMSLISDFTTDKNREVGMGILLISQSIARSTGSILGGLIADKTSLKGLIPISTSIMLIAGISTIIFINDKVKITKNSIN